MSAGAATTAPWSWVAERRRALPAIAAVALLARLPRLGESLWYDEVYYSTLQVFGTFPALWRSLLRDTPGPIYRLLGWSWASLAGEHEVVVRLPSLLCGIGSILLLYELARRLAGPAVALAAALFLALSPVHVWYSQEAVPYALLLLLVTLAATAAERILSAEAPRRRDVVTATVALAAAPLTHLHAAALLAPFALAAARARPRPRRTLLLATAVAGALFAAYMLAKRKLGVVHTAQGFLRPFDAFEAWMLHFHWFLSGNAVWTVSPYRADLAWLAARPGLLAPQLVALALALRGVRRALAAGAAGLLVPAIVAATPLALAAANAAGYRQLYIERYALVGLPFFVLLVFWGAAGDRAGRAAGGALLALGLAAWVGCLVRDDRWTVYKPNADWRAVARHVLATSPPATTVVVTLTPSGTVAYHLRRAAGGAPRPQVRITSRFHAERAAREGTRVAFVAIDQFWRGNPEWAIHKLEAAGWRAVESKTFFGAELHRFEAPPAPAPAEADP